MNYETLRMKLGQILLDEGRFQNRAELNQAIVNEIAENFDPNQFDPVVIWKDPKDGKIYLLAGHHRYAGIKKAGRKKIKVRWFKGSEAEAITYAKELSNANRTLETPLERAAIYREKLKRGEDPKQVRKQAEKLEGKNWRYILNLARLNPDGKTVNALLALVDNSDKVTQQNLEKIADWIGEARRQFDQLTNTHENEMYDFLLDNFKAKKPAISRKDVWIERVRAIVQALDFNAANPLNLKRIQYKTQGESEYEAQMREIDQKIDQAEKKKQELRDRFNKPSHK
ncbi:ParB N-terminal domain-containing protein [Flavilitoribacter nigricans]|nr:ParB N-terminal domain-containing protein [Flavilitoribacter nigricans]